MISRSPSGSSTVRRMILVAGEALIDLVISPSGDVSAALGGAPFNTARACSRLGGDVSFLGAISVDRFGQMLATQLADDGVDLAHASRVDRPTTLAAAELDEHGAATYRFYIEGTSAPALDRSDADGLRDRSRLLLHRWARARARTDGVGDRAADRPLVVVECRDDRRELSPAADRTTATRTSVACVRCSPRRPSSRSAPTTSPTSHPTPTPSTPPARLLDAGATGGAADRWFG